MNTTSNLEEPLLGEKNHATSSKVQMLHDSTDG